ncbi:MAG: YdcF family protein [Anaerolineales bacterium]|nr:YdcF family protein [Anaerolineales bacterium]
MFLYLSKLLPLFFYPLGFACLLLVALLLLRRHTRWVVALALAALLVLWLGGNRLVSIALLRSLEWQYLPPDPLPPADAIVVLGGGARPATWPRTTAEVNEAGDRLIYAAKLYQDGVAPKLLLSGGAPVADAPNVQTEAESMASLLEIMGVPRTALLQDPSSRNTYENAIETRSQLEEQGIDRIVLVTSASHMPRSVAIYEKQGFDVIPAPTDFLVTQADWDYYFSPDPSIQLFNLFPTAENLERTGKALKEWVGLAVYRLRGWA